MNLINCQENFFDDSFIFQFKCHSCVFSQCFELHSFLLNPVFLVVLPLHIPLHRPIQSHMERNGERFNRKKHTLSNIALIVGTNVFWYEQIINKKYFYQTYKKAYTSMNWRKYGFVAPIDCGKT